MSKPLKFAVLGCGMIVERAHLPGLAATGTAEVAVLFGPDNDRSRRLIDRIGDGVLVHDLNAALDRDDLDGVIVALPNFQHRQAVEMAAAKRLPVLCEKPLATTIADARAMIASMDKAEAIMAMSLPNRQRPSLQYLKALVDDGHFGTLRSIEVKMIRRAGIPSIGSWFTTKSLSGGGVLMDLGPHAVDAAMWLAGFPEIDSVEADISSLHGPQGVGLGDWGVHRVGRTAATFDVDDQANLTLRARDGLILKVEVSWATFGADENRIRIIGDHGGADYWPEGNGMEFPLRLFGYDSSGRISDSAVKEIASDHADLEPAWKASVADFVAAVGKRGKPAATGHEALAVAELIARAYDQSSVRP